MFKTFLSAFFEIEGTLKPLLSDNQLEDVQGKPLKDKHGNEINGFKRRLWSSNDVHGEKIKLKLCKSINN